MLTRELTFKSLNWSQAQPLQRLLSFETILTLEWQEEHFFLAAGFLLTLIVYPPFIVELRYRNLTFLIYEKDCKLAGNLSILQ